MGQKFTRFALWCSHRDAPFITFRRAGSPEGAHAAFVGERLCADLGKRAFDPAPDEGGRVWRMGDDHVVDVSTPELLGRLAQEYMEWWDIAVGPDDPDPGPVLEMAGAVLPPRGRALDATWIACCWAEPGSHPPTRVV